MFETEIQAALRDIPLGGLRVFNSIRSTNDEALAWAAQNANDMSLVVADEQTAGRGRANRHWHTAAGTALAFSLILRQSHANFPSLGRLAGLGPLAISEVCATLGMQAKIKWPNDVLLAGRKVGGVLVESSWNGSLLEAVIVGIGVNIRHGSIPPQESLSFPATCIESELGHPTDRIDFLGNLLHALLKWRSKLISDEFIKAWESRLAFRGQHVTLSHDNGSIVTGVLEGLKTDGSLRLVTSRGPTVVRVGEIHLRPIEAENG